MAPALWKQLWVRVDPFPCNLPTRPDAREVHGFAAAVVVFEPNVYNNNIYQFSMKLNNSYSNCNFVLEPRCERSSRWWADRATSRAAPTPVVSAAFAVRAIRAFAVTLWWTTMLLWEMCWRGADGRVRSILPDLRYPKMRIYY